LSDREYRDDGKLDFLRARYEFEAWGRGERPEESLFVWRYFLTPRDLPGYRPERIEAREAEEEWPRSIRSLWRSEDDPEALLDALVLEADARDSARDLLLRTLGQFQAILERREGIGDVAFGAGEGALVFALANLVIVLRTAGGKPPPIAQVAQHLEREVRSRPEPGGKVVPEISKFDAEPGDRETLRLVLEAADPLDRPLWFKVFSVGGDVHAREGELVFLPYDDGRNEVEVTVFAINQNGGAATRSLRLPLSA
jgi:hypothetical protein